MLTLASTFKITAVSIRIRIEEDFVLRIHRGLPRDSPNTSPYFSQPPHTYDQYSISFSFIPHRTISGKSLVFGNDFEHPVRDRIPPGFDAAFGIVKWAIDPGLDGDVYADKPYLYGNALSSINILSVGPKVDEKDSLDDLTSDTGKDGVAITEGGFGGGQELREALNIPANAAARQKWFLGGHDRLENWNWEEGRVYKADFFNPYLDFNGTSCPIAVIAQVTEHVLSCRICIEAPWILTESPRLPWRRGLPKACAYHCQQAMLFS